MIGADSLKLLFGPSLLELDGVDNEGTWRSRKHNWIFELFLAGPSFALRPGVAGKWRSREQMARPTNTLGCLNCFWRGHHMLLDRIYMSKTCPKKLV